ncbi:type I-E CRISPR-associated protein Cas6/Cse3/CasE [Thermomonas brevis]
MIFSELKWATDSRDGRRRANQLRQSPYIQHQALWSLFQRPQGSIAPFLFRHETAADDPTFWMLSETAPHDGNGDWRIRSRPFAPQLAEGDQLQFQLRANPSISVPRDATGNSRSRGIRTSLIGHVLARCDDNANRGKVVSDALLDWLGERGERNGFALETTADGIIDCMVEQPRHWRFSGRDRRPMTLAVADFVGRLRVTDAERFTACIREGLGHGKRFGLGMWLLRRARD